MTSASEDLDQQCKHELTRRTCGLCNGVAERFRREHDLEVERVLALGGWFPARYGGRCGGCSETFHPGTPIRRKQEEEFRTTNGNEYVAMCCAPKEGEE
jgi:hypothetical protein